MKCHRQQKAPIARSVRGFLLLLQEAHQLKRILYSLPTSELRTERNSVHRLT